MPVGAHITESFRQKIREAITKEPSDKAIAQALGTTDSTVRAERRKMISEGVDVAVRPDPEQVMELHDLDFWRRKAAEADKRATQADAALRELAGMAKRPIIVPKWAMSKSGKRGRAVGLLHVSDVHDGEVVRPEEVGGLNEYNPDICAQRLRRLWSATTTIIPRWASDCALGGIVVALNGDLVSGAIHAELRETNALTAHEQVGHVTDELALGIATLAEAFGNVLVMVTPGNHGRSTDKPHFKRMAALSYDIMVGNMLARHFKADKRITVNIASGPDLVYQVVGQTILQTHGDNMGASGGQGFAGPNLPIVRGSKKIQLAGFASGEHYDLILSAHFHVSSNPGRTLANGSVIGYNEFVQSRIRAEPEPPQQWIGLLHEKWGLRERMPVVLEEPRRPERTAVNMPMEMV